MSSWTTIESDPGVFTEMVENLGVKDVQIEELVALSDDEFARIKPAFGLIFLFKWVAGLTSDGKPLAPEETDPDLFFAKQVVHNACATQAILSLLFNNPAIDIGQKLAEFKTFVHDFPADLKGDAIGNNEMVRDVHNSFARPEPIMYDDSSSKSGAKSEDVFHFVAYVPFKGRVYELDGLKSGPIPLCEAGADWLLAVRPHIEARIAKYASAQLLFNLMALIRDRRVVLNDSLAKAEAAGNEQVCAQLTQQLAEENEKRRMWAEENVRRKHNYIPFIVATLHLLAQRKKLKGLVHQAQLKQQQRMEQR